MRYLLFSTMLFSGCVSHYNALERIPINERCLEAMMPKPLLTSWYNASIDVVGKHISGLLLIKNMPDSSKRILFTSETGVTVFDFAFSNDRQFKIHTIIKPLDRRPVIKTLREDFGLITHENLKGPAKGAFRNEKEQILFAFPQNGETLYLFTSEDCKYLKQLETGSRKRKSSVKYYGTNEQAPDSIFLQHHTFNMTITLRKLPVENVAE